MSNKTASKFEYINIISTWYEGKYIKKQNYKVKKKSKEEFLEAEKMNLFRRL